MKGLVNLQGREVPYVLTRRQVKNVNIRVRADGSVGVSADPQVPQEAVEDILRRRSKFILGALDKFAAQGTPEPPAYQSGDRVYFLGKPYFLQVFQGETMGSELVGDILCLTVPDPEDRAQREEAYRSFQKAQCVALTARLCREFQPAMAHLGVPEPGIRVRPMTTRWGSCTPKRCRVTFASQLIEAPEECVAYVVWHELTHFVHPNHSQAFYDCLAQFCPNWKALRYVLNHKTYHLPPPGMTLADILE
jgi:hypothetical protein